MGISGLLPILKPNTTKRHLSHYRGKTACIDTFSWLHKGAIGDAAKLAHGSLNHKNSCYIRYVFKYIDLLIANGITPLLVFDGENLPSKSETESKRRKNRKEKLEEGKRLERIGQHNEAFKCFQMALDVSFEMVQTVIEKCIKRKLDYLVAPYEADIQLTYLVKHGYADFAITEDSDLVALGCPLTIFKMKFDSNFVDEISLDNVLQSGVLGTELATLQNICVLNGCDYLPGGVPGIGLKTAMKMLEKGDKLEDLETAFSEVAKVHKHKELFFQKAMVALMTFHHQVVFCPGVLNRRYFTELREGFAGRILFLNFSWPLIKLNLSRCQL